MAGTIKHSWNGTVLTIESDSGVSSCDLKGSTGDTGIRGPQGIAGDKGERGPVGERGPAGENGVGVPVGGSTGQILTKASDADYDTKWANKPTPSDIGAVAKSGDTMSDNLTISKDSGDTKFTVTNENGSVSLATNNTRGIYDNGNSKWVLSSAPGSADWTLNGTAENVSGVVSISNGGTGKSDRASAMYNLLTNIGHDVTDCDSATEIGTYGTFPTWANLPVADYGTLFTYRPNENWIVQIWTSTDQSDGRMFMRKSTNGGAFGAWHEK